jgi:hypothetical protein
MQATTTDVATILRRVNPVEPGGDWSVFDVARMLDPAARNPSHMFDTGPDTWPRDEYVDLARELIAEIQPSARFVGGVSQHLYSLADAR